jgi:DNA-binding Lrp family transcriptional regulator
LKAARSGIWNIMTTSSIPVETTDAVNARILAVSEDRIRGFQSDPFGEIASLCELPVDTVLERIQAMLAAGTIRRVRQTLMATNLAKGALVAWEVPEEKLSSIFDYMFQQDPFSGHIVVRSTDTVVSGSVYRLWTTIKVPQGYSLEKHCDLLCRLTGAKRFKIMPAKRLFALGVGHVRRRGLEPGSKSEDLAEVLQTNIVELSGLEWQVLTALKREFAVGEIQRNVWAARAEEADVDLNTFYEVGRALNERGVIGRFSTFLEHVKPNAAGERVTKFNALFHWAVPEGREIEAGQQVGRFHIMTHAYWREGGPEFSNVNIMGVAHGTDKELLLAHKAAMDAHLAEVDIPVSYTNVFWGGRSEIKPSEISPFAYAEWCKSVGINPADMIA